MWVQYADGHLGQEEVRFVVVHSRARVPQETKAAAMAQAKEAVQVDVHSKRVAAQQYACAADAEAAIAVYEGRAPGRSCRRHPWRYHTLCYHVEVFSRRNIRERRGCPARTDQLQVEQCYRVVVDVEAIERIEAEDGWTVLATTLDREVCTDAEILQAYHDRQSTVTPGFCWIKNPAAIPPMWLEKPERIATLAMLTVLGLLVYALIQRQVRLYLHDNHLHLPGSQGLTATPTAAEVLTLFTPVRLDNTPAHHIHGVEPHHLLVCDALGIDRTWYEVQSHQEPRA